VNRVIKRLELYSNLQNNKKLRMWYYGKHWN
jgi:hypothetical protein